MSAQSQAAVHLQVSDWWTVKTGPPVKVLPALQRLCTNRNTGRRIDLDSASALLRWMHATPRDADVAEVQTCCLLLLGQWVNGELYRPLKQPSGESLVEVISKSADAALAVAGSFADQSSPRLAAATVYALGCVSSGLGTLQRRECCSAACAVLHNSGSGLLESGLISDVIGGVGHLLTSLQDDMQGSLWVLACLLFIWSGQASPTQPHDQALDSMAPLYPAARRVASSLKDPAACLPSYVELLQAGTASSEGRVASAATLTAGGVLEGLHRNTRAKLPHNTDAGALERILSAACRAATSSPGDSVGQYPGPGRMPAGQPEADELYLLQRDAAALASMEAFQACKRPPASQESLLCMLHALLDSTLTLDGLFQGAASGADPAQANAWLQAHVEGCLMRSAASLARTVAEQYKQSAPAHQQAAMDCVRDFSHRLYGAYERYAQDATETWLAEVDGGLVRQVMDKVFMSIVLLLSTFWDAAAPEEAQDTAQKSKASSRQGIAVGLMDTLAHVQFCRMRLSAYSVLLQSLLQTTASSPKASSGLLECLPTYEALLEERPTGQPAWLSNSVLASRMQFLMGILAPCVPQLPEAAVREHVISAALLFLKHTHSPVVSSAHMLFCAAFRHVCAKEELVPLYVRRSLEGYPGITPLSGLASGYEAIARHLPAGSPVLLFALQRLAQRAQAILHKPGGLLQPGLDLVSLLAHLMLLIDYNALEDGLLLLEEVVKACEQHIALQACSSIVDILSGSDDYTRKVTLVRWYMRLADMVTRGKAGTLG